MTDRSMGAVLRNLKGRVTSLERRLARTPTRPDVGQLADVGDVKITARASAPAGWLLCTGQSLLRASYPALFDAIGVLYGAADATHFNVPDLRGRVVAGRDGSQSEFDTMGEKAGAKTHTLSVTEMPSHSHTQQTLSGVVAPGGGSALTGMAIAGGTYVPSSAATVGAGGGEAHNNLQPYIVLNYIIKA